MRGGGSRKGGADEVICEFEARDVGVGVFEVDDDEFFVLVCGFGARTVM